MKLSRLEWVIVVVSIIGILHFATRIQLEQAIEPSAPSPLTLTIKADQKPVRIVLFGDSLDADKAYGEHLQERLALFGEIILINKSRPQTTQAALGRLASLLHADIDLLILAQGYDDLNHGRRHLDIAARIQKMVDRIKKKGVPILLIGRPDPDLLDLSITSDLGFYSSIATRNHLPYCHDVWGSILTDPSLFDGYHPTPKGYRAAAQKLYDCMTEYIRWQH